MTILLIGLLISMLVLAYRLYAWGITAIRLILNPFGKAGEEIKKLS